MGDFRSQCISRHGIDPQHRNIPSPAPEEIQSRSFILYPVRVSECYKALALNIDAATKWPPFRRRHFETHFLMKMYEFRLKCYWSLLLGVKLTTFQHWCRRLGIVMATSHYLNQWWYVSLTRICVTLPQWVNRQEIHCNSCFQSRCTIERGVVKINLICAWSFLRFCNWHCNQNTADE